MEHPWDIDSTSSDYVSRKSGDATSQKEDQADYEAPEGPPIVEDNNGTRFGSTLWPHDYDSSSPDITYEAQEGPLIYEDNDLPFPNSTYWPQNYDPSSPGIFNSSNGRSNRPHGQPSYNIEEPNISHV